jgi:ABC-type amino acid transport substrate-binding protein/chorismate mutase
MFFRAGLFLELFFLVTACSTAATPPARELAPPSAAAPSVAVAPAPAVAPPAAARLPVLRVGTSGDYAPFSTRDAAGELQGFDVELAGVLASELGFELRWVPFRWPDLARQLGAGEFDVAMGGVTWQPARDVAGYMTRAIARGGPCVLGDAAAPRVAVNRGGILESWARRHLAERELITVDDNQSLPELLAAGRVGAIVTDSFELRAFARPGWAQRCEPALARKVYWVAPAAPGELGARIDAWLGSHTERVQGAQQRWIGERQRLDASTHLVDLIARRFAFMPLVARLKAERNLPIEDLPREREVLAAVAAGARREGLPERAAVDLFALQIELSKAVQRRQHEPSTLDLGAQIRPALSALGDRILTALAQARRDQRLSALAPADLELLSPWLTPDERERLRRALLAVAAP